MSETSDADRAADLGLQVSGYRTRRLDLGDEGLLQRLYERCADYFLLVEGQPPAPSAGRDGFLDVPEGKTVQDKDMFGLFEAGGDLVGLLEGIRHYPDERTWWLGLLLLAPEERGAGLGDMFYAAFERWARVQGVQQVMLAVVEENEAGLRFWTRLGFEVVRKVARRPFGKKLHGLSVMRRTLVHQG